MHVHNSGSQALEKGDLVCLAGGYQQNVLGEDDSEPLVNVQKANAGNSQAVFGVVQYKVYIREEVEELEEETIITKSFRHADGSAGFGEYLSVVVLGPADVKIASGEDIKVGEAIAAADGVARKVRTTEINGITIAENTGIVGKALENANGSGKLKVFVNCR
ncbi:MAG: hypothetical protein K9N09_11195 [Candidatus Cloacimonetes bacterium]|nr:hypothetical protein [Candidatus Cloacimonadota bacterium]MCF7815035.1 hypothetical protein [Candidatus Cloacimonadota bacterium]MCF7869252.1 hypothetical protein [Candidatus Cloacimonadota bacterium]MCF7884686.1 hypothetical protein [Candidatus Cloacimonadota bacterium]